MIFASEAVRKCIDESMRARLHQAGLRPTRQRLALSSLLFANGDRHVTAEALFEDAAAAHERISLATVYNTLHQFTAAGLLREIAIDGAKTYFDTNTGDHQHFLVEESARLLDIPGGGVSLSRLPEAPDGMEISRVDVVVRLRRKM